MSARLDDENVPKVGSRRRKVVWWFVGSVSAVLFALFIVNLQRPITTTIDKRTGLSVVCNRLYVQLHPEGNDSERLVEFMKENDLRIVHEIPDLRLYDLEISGRCDSNRVNETIDRALRTLYINNAYPVTVVTPNSK